MTQNIFLKQHLIIILICRGCSISFFFHFTLQSLKSFAVNEYYAQSFHMHLRLFIARWQKYLESRQIAPDKKNKALKINLTRGTDNAPLENAFSGDREGK